MSYKITSLLLAVILIIWQVMMWKKIKLPKWADYSLSVMMVLVALYLVYLAWKF